MGGVGIRTVRAQLSSSKINQRLGESITGDRTSAFRHG
jgi:hypothetical protein